MRWRRMENTAPLRLSVTGGIMVLGLKCGRGESQDRSATEEAYAKNRRVEFSYR